MPTIPEKSRPSNKCFHNFPLSTTTQILLSTTYRKLYRFHTENSKLLNFRRISVRFLTARIFYRPGASNLPIFLIGETLFRRNPLDEKLCVPAFLPTETHAVNPNPSRLAGTHHTSLQSGINPSFSMALMCTTSRRIPVIPTSYQGTERDDSDATSRQILLIATTNQ